jgi:hypothetical protein
MDPPVACAPAAPGEANAEKRDNTSKAMVVLVKERVDTFLGPQEEVPYD